MSTIPPVERGTPAEDRLAPGVVPALVAMGLAIFLIANDVTAMSVSLPGIEKDLNSDISSVQWVVSAYALVFGVLIVTGGRLADMLGRRRMLLVGAGIFGVFSLLGGAAPTIGVLLLARGLQGIGAALMWPATLGLLYAILPDSKADLAGGLVIGIAGLGNAAGPLVGGVLTQSLSWRWILLLNVPIAAVTCLVTLRTVPADRPTERGAVDYAGIAAISVGLFALLIALNEAPDIGWTSPVVLGLFVACVVLLAGFVLRERGAGAAALIPRDVMTNPHFRAACIAVACMSATFFACLLYLPQLLQKVLGYDALAAGAGLLPLMATFAVTSFVEGTLVSKVGAGKVIVTGAAAMTVGTFLLLGLTTDTSGFLALVPGMVVLGVGIGLFYSAVTTAGVTALDPSQSSLAGGILYMFQIAGGAVGLGLSTSAFLLGSNHGISGDARRLHLTLSASERAGVRSVLAGAESGTQLVARLAHGTADRLTEVVRSAFVGGLHWALALDGALAVIGLLLATRVVARLRSGRADEAVAAAGPAAAAQALADPGPAAAGGATPATD